MQYKLKWEFCFCRHPVVPARVVHPSLYPKPIPDKNTRLLWNGWVLPVHLILIFLGAGINPYPPIPEFWSGMSRVYFELLIPFTWYDILGRSLRKGRQIFDTTNLAILLRIPAYNWIDLNGGIILHARGHDIFENLRRSIVRILDIIHYRRYFRKAFDKNSQICYSYLRVC